MTRFLGLAIGLFLSWNACAQQAPHSPTLDAVRKSGVLRVGVKTDFKPFNYLDSNGEVVGLESDVAALVAQRLGVRLKKVRITTENRFQKLALGEVDLLIATVADTPERRRSAAAVEPGYNETSVNVLFGPGHAVDDWGKIRNRTTCAVQGSYFNKPMSERYLLKLQTYKTVRDALLALRDDQCSGFLYATAVLQNTLKLPEWSGYSMTLSNAIIKPMTIFMARDERGTRLDVALGDITAELHRSGWLLEENRKWGITSNEWLTRQHELWSATDATGKPVCTRGANGLWTAACRSSEYVASSEVGGIQALGLRLKEHLGIDLNFVYDPYDRTQFLRGVAYTMMLIASGIAISLALGTLAATAVDARAGLAPRLLRGFMAYGRLTPPLIMMYLIFFGIGGWSQREFGVKLPAFAVATFCSGYYTAGLVMRALLEAARHIRGFEPAFALRLHTLYRSAHYASWPVKQALINLTKQTMLASAIAIPELLSASSLLIAENGNIFMTMTVLLITFYLTTRLWTLIIERVERLILAPPAKP
ncbi:transporter substrate-binding domain-containing protein [Massilia forsythiae]|uniref:transporter substrate-binding domain-containing protein n=1 Tax=Massilia forsythiae TaxID=2728020 RepID=UPI001E62BF09|nr:transporter substrate-binding domain-containing protein [Massilia forsythiae]